MPRPTSRLALLAALLLLLRPVPAAPATYYVDGATGVDDVGRDGLSAATAWRSLTFAVRRMPSPGPHEVVVAAGEYTEAAGEDFPLTIPPDVSVTGAGADLTVFHDVGNATGGTLRWVLREGTVLTVQPTFKDFTVVRDKVLGQPVGAAFELRAFSAIATPRLTNLILRGANRGLDMLAEGDTAAATLSPAVEACRFLENGNGVLSTSYTVTGATTRVNPTFLNCVAMRNQGEGMLFETAAMWEPLQAGQRGNATSAPIITHCTLAENLGSGIFLDNSNGYLTNRTYWAGSVSPRVTNSVLTGNGDYALHEYTSATDPAQFDLNLVGGNLVALYRNEGNTDEIALSGVPGSGNIAAAALFQRSLLPDFHLRGDSPGIDRITTGFAAVDADGETRPIDSDGIGGAAAEMGADEAQRCAVNAALDPAAPADRCGLEPPLVLSALASAMATGFTCTLPLEYTWYADGVEVATGPELSVVPPVTTTYSVVVRCGDFPHCTDARTVTVVVHTLPAVNAEAGVLGPTGDYEACIAWDAPDVLVDLLGTAVATEDSAAITGQSWSAADGILLGGASLMPQLAINQTGANQDIAVSLTATDSHGCENTSFTIVHAWRGPRPLPGGPYSACQDVGAPQTFVPLDGAADIPAGSAAASWLWRTDVGQFEDSNAATSTLEDPRLKLTNFGFNRTANLTLAVTDDKGCTDDSTTSLTLYWTPAASANGPYQEPETPPGPTTVAVSGSFTGPPGTTLSWTTDLGTFQSTGTQAADGGDQMIEIVNAGSDQLGTACLTATPASGLCPTTDCTAISVRTSPPQPPHDVGATFRIDEVGGVAQLSWANPPIDATHDRADLFDLWEALVPSAGNWTPRAALQDVPRIAGRVVVDDPTLMDVAGPDLLFLLVVSENAGGFSCANPAAQLPDCPSLEDCGNGVDDDEDFRADCEDPGCAGVPPCP